MVEIRIVEDDSLLPGHPIRRRIERWLWSGGRVRSAFAKKVPMYFSDVDYMKPCKGRNGNVCVAEGCFGEACVK